MCQKIAQLFGFRPAPVIVAVAPSQYMMMGLLIADMEGQRDAE